MSTETISVEGSGHECDVKLDTWLRDMLPVTPGCTAKVRKRALILACREFFEQSSAWRVTIGPKHMVANKKRYYMSPYDAYANVVRVFSVEYDGLPLPPLNRRPVRSVVSTDTTRPLYYYMDTPEVVCLHPLPTVTVEEMLTFYVALMPKQSVTHLPRVASTHFYDAIYDGALGRLYSQPAKPYSDTEKAAYHLNRFRAAIGKYAGQAKTNFSSAATWRFPVFGK